MELVELRKKLDELDNDLIEVLTARILHTKKIAQAKIKLGQPLVDKNRESEVIKNRTIKFRELGIDDSEFVEKLYRLIIDESLKIEESHLNSLGLKNDK